MGGGGRGSHRPDVNTEPPRNNDEQQAGSAAQRAQSNGFTLTGGADKLDYLDDAMDGYEWLEREFPQIKGYITEITYDPNSAAMAYCGSSIGPDGLWRSKIALTSTFNSWANGGDGDYYHSLDTLDSLRATGAHEFTHALVQQIANREVAQKYTTWEDRSGALYDIFKSSEIEHRVLDKAIRNIRASTGLTTREVRRQVSDYATENYHETLAECIGDYFARGESAAPLSVAAFHALKDMLK